jgi:SAM-dependent methyltransferase
MADARHWAESAMEKRPWRLAFFRSFAAELEALGRYGLSILELGSGPGFLAEHVLAALPSADYWALDFSAAMHELARERLGDKADRVRFLLADFKADGWANGLGHYDAVITMQAVHEVRHKRHVPSLLTTVGELLTPGGVFLMCDHIVGEGGMTDSNLYMTQSEQKEALLGAGFSQVDLVKAESGLVLWRATQ